MKRTTIFFWLITATFGGGAQPVSLELMPGQDHIFFQPAFSTKMSDHSKFGFVQVASYINRYHTAAGKAGAANEIMNQAYASMAAGKSLSLLTGFFYTNATGITPSAAIQFVHSFKNGTIVLVPRADIRRKANVEMMAMLEYTAALSVSTKLYTRLQVMSNAGPKGHNRSWQRIRVGLERKGTQIGIGLNLDEYGKGNQPKLNAGVFVRRLIF
jgi:hypothetical protein